MNDGLKGFPGQGGLTDLPGQALLWQAGSRVLAGNAITPFANSSQHGDFARQEAAADSDTFEQDFLLRAGAYTLAVLGYTVSTAGKIDWYLDEIQIVSGQDWYSGSAIYNVLKTTSGILVAVGGLHTLRGKVNGKNGSSSAYEMNLTWMRLT
jgi:hypothetical protein